ncbi:unnamed protein product, partial [Ectocarpus fasciculatus]
DGSSKTPLFFARNLAMCETLVENGADVDARDSSGKTPVMEL